MVMKMNKNFYLSLASVAILLLVIIIPSVIKVNKRHNDHLLRVVESKIIERAEDCYYKEECNGKITLKELYEKKYLDIVANPISKEYYNELSYVIIHEDQKSEFKEISTKKS